jgi:hypothetical protein
MKDFGQEVFVSIKTSDNVEILKASGLRVDFDIREEPGYGRATVTIFNLNSETIGNLIGGTNDHFISLTTMLHGQQSYTLMDNYFISNAVDEKVLPNTITTLYCYDANEVQIYQKQLATYVEKPTLARQIDKILKDNGVGNVKFQGFPDDLVNLEPPRTRTELNGSVTQLMNSLGREYNFEWFSEPNNGVLLVYKPTVEQVQSGKTDWYDQKPIKLNTDNMRANPKLGVAQLSIDSNLNGDIHPGGMVDIGALLTAGVDMDAKTLQFTQGALSSAVAGIGLYQILHVRHIGSNWTDKWNTVATGLAPTEGLPMNPNRDTWFRNNFNN